jgi:asparagine synthase (glutamine-hydrolysing)
MKAFLALKCYDFSFDKEVIDYAKQNIHQLETTEFCLLSGVKRLLGGHNLFFNLVEGLHVSQWWITSEHLVSVSDNQEEQVQKFNELFFDACKIRMRSDVPIGTSLSGGLDSSSVLATIHAIGMQEGYTSDFQKAFLADYSGTELDERKYAEIMIEATKATPIINEITYNDFIHHLKTIIYHLEDFYCIPAEGLWLNYKKMREQGVFVSLDGHGADELLAGYVSIYTDLISYLLKNPLIFNLKTYLDAKKTRAFFDCSSQFDNSYYKDFLFFLKNIIYYPKRLLVKHKSDKQICCFDSITSNSLKIKYYSEKTALWNILNQYFHKETLPTILRNFDRMSMAHGIEIRMPFMDYRLVTYAFSLNDEAFTSHSYSKYIFRKATEGILPDSIRLRRNKIGFSSPMKKWYLEGLANDIISMVYPFYQSSPDIFTSIDANISTILTAENKNEELEKPSWDILHEMLLITSFYEKREELMLEIGC